MICDSGLHGRRHSKRLVNPRKVVIHEVERHGVSLILNLLAEGIGQSGHPSHTHPHREILPLDKAG